MRYLLLTELGFGPKPAPLCSRPLAALYGSRQNKRGSSWANADSMVSMAEAVGVLVLAHAGN
jgi:hypothetical protein